MKDGAVTNIVMFQPIRYATKEEVQAARTSGYDFSRPDGDRLVVINDWMPSVAYEYKVIAQGAEDNCR